MQNLPLCSYYFIPYHQSNPLKASLVKNIPTGIEGKFICQQRRLQLKHLRLYRDPSNGRTLIKNVCPLLRSLWQMELPSVPEGGDFFCCSFADCTWNFKFLQHFYLVENLWYILPPKDIYILYETYHHSCDNFAIMCLGLDQTTSFNWRRLARRIIITVDSQKAKLTTRR